MDWTSFALGAVALLAVEIIAFKAYMVIDLKSHDTKGD
jgi:hypothetical protein